MIPGRVVHCIRVSFGLGLLFAAGVSGQQNSLFQGSVPGGAVSPTPLNLTLDDAIRRSLKFNLGLLESQSASQTARADRIQALSALLPQVGGTFSETDEQLNLKTFGFNVPPNPYLTIPTIVGPFSYTAAEASVSAKVIDFNARRNLKSARAAEQAAQLSLQDARDLVVQATANAYLLVIADASRVRAIQAQTDTDQALYQRASDQHTAGVAAAIDVLRAQVQLKTEQQALLAQQDQFDKDKLALGRVIGLRAAQVFGVADVAPFSPLTAVGQEEALRTALAQRPDYQSAQRLVDAAQQTLAAARAEWYPTVDLNGFYGDEGTTLASSHGVFSIVGALNFNIYTGGRIHADMEKARAALKQRSDELADLGAQIEVEVRDAFLDLRSTADQVTVARENLGLANQTLSQAQDRFSAGVTDNIEVVQAQESVADANDAYIASLYRYNTSKISMARAIGIAESNYALYLKGQ